MLRVFLGVPATGKLGDLQCIFSQRRVVTRDREELIARPTPEPEFVAIPPLIRKSRMAELVMSALRCIDVRFMLQRSISITNRYSPRCVASVIISLCFLHISYFFTAFLFCNLYIV